MMAHIYCISGFGADERIFSKINFGNHEVNFLQWLSPARGESLQQYAARMLAGVHHDKSILIGVSFGGIMAIEMAKLRAFTRVIIISSIKADKELPGWMKLAGRLKLDKVIPLRSFKITEPIQNYHLGIETAEELRLVREYRRNIPLKYTNWGIHEILNWRNDWQPEGLVQINGTNDHIFPIRNISADFVVKGGGHFMVMNRATEINGILNNLLSGD